MADWGVLLVLVILPALAFIAGWLLLVPGRSNALKRTVLPWGFRPVPNLEMVLAGASVPIISDGGIVRNPMAGMLSSYDAWLFDYSYNHMCPEAFGETHKSRKTTVLLLSVPGLKASRFRVAPRNA